MDNNRNVRILYQNHRGDVGWRTIRPHNLFFGKTEYHPKPQYLLEAFDVVKGKMRTFAMDFIYKWEPIKVEKVSESEEDKNPESSGINLKGNGVEMNTLPYYISPVRNVRALLIYSIERLENNSAVCIITPEDQKFNSIQANYNWVEEQGAKPGGFMVWDGRGDPFFLTAEQFNTDFSPV